MSPDTSEKLRVGAVSFLNTVPLVYGMTHGPQRERVELTFSLPSLCASQVESGAIQIGIVPVAEIARQGLEIVSDVGIAARGAVRSILLFSKVPWSRVRILAADWASRTSVQLARVILQERFNVAPSVLQFEPNLHAMLAAADAALIIGDPALKLDPPYKNLECIDLAEAWFEMTGLPFVFACWAAKPGLDAGRIRELTRDSYIFGCEHLSQIVDEESASRHIPRTLADNYLRHHLRYELGASEMAGLELFLSLAGLSGVPA